MDYQEFKSSFARNYPGFSEQAIACLFRKYGTAAESYKYIGWINSIPAGDLIRSQLEGTLDIGEWLKQWEWYEILDHEVIVKREWSPTYGWDSDR